MKSNPINEIITFYSETVLNAKGFKPTVNFGRDGFLIKTRLKEHSVEEIKDILTYYLDSEKAKQFGVSLSIALSSHTINLWKEKKNKETKENKDFNNMIF